MHIPICLLGQRISWNCPTSYGFNNTSSDHIKESMRARSVPKTLVDWTENMLANRRLTATHGNFTITGLANTGCPQKRVFSPTLWNLVVDELLSEFRRRGIKVYDYADDLAILISGPFVDTIKDLMKETLKFVLNWCNSNSWRLIRAKPSWCCLQKIRI